MVGSLSACTTKTPILSSSPPLYRQGMSAFSQGNFKQATLLFNEVIEKHVGSYDLAEPQWMLARSLEKEGAYDRALLQYRLFVKNYPDHPHRKEADQRITKLAQQWPQDEIKRSIRFAAILTFSDRTSTASVDKMLHELEMAGMDAVIVKVFRNRTRAASPGVFYRTSHAPVIMDRLTPLISSAERHGLMVLAWMSVRRMDWMLHSNPGWNDLRYDVSTKTVIPSGSLDLFQSDVRESIRLLYQDLASYAIDGIVFGDDLFYETSEGLGQAALEQFGLVFGSAFSPSILDSDVRMISDEIFWRWVGWKSRQVYSFLDGLKEELKKEYPLLRFGILFSDDVLLNPVGALVKNSQDLLEGFTHLLDYYIVSLDFSTDTESSVDSSSDIQNRLSEAAAGARQLLGPTPKLLLRIQSGVSGRSMSWKDGLEREESNQALWVMKNINPSIFWRLLQARVEPLDLIFSAQYTQ
jgi:hypothetical protein